MYESSVKTARNLKNGHSFFFMVVGVGHSVIVDSFVSLLHNPLGGNDVVQKRNVSDAIFTFLQFYIGLVLQ